MGNARRVVPRTTFPTRCRIQRWSRNLEFARVKVTSCNSIFLPGISSLVQSRRSSWTDLHDLRWLLHSKQDKCHHHIQAERILSRMMVPRFLDISMAHYWVSYQQYSTTRGKTYTPWKRMLTTASPWLPTGWVTTEKPNQSGQTQNHWICPNY